MDFEEQREKAIEKTRDLMSELLDKEIPRLGPTQRKELKGA